MRNALIASIGFASALFLTPATSAADIKLYTFNCGEIDMNDLSLFARGGEFDGKTNKAGDACFLIRHPKGDLLWDTGLPKAIAEAEDGIVNGPYKLTLKTTLESQLTQIGVTAADIEYLSISHSHFDHTGNMNDYASATWLVHEDEYADMFSDEKRSNPQSMAAYNQLENSKTVKFSGDYDVFGDGTVKIMEMPGHTPGHTTLTVELENSGTVMLSGDLYHLTESRELRTVPTFNTDPEETLNSMDRFEAFAAENNARVVIQHEKADTRKLPKLPEYLD